MIRRRLAAVKILGTQKEIWLESSQKVLSARCVHSQRQDILSSLLSREVDQNNDIFLVLGSSTAKF